MKAFVLVVAILFAGDATAFAQATDNPVTTHYRAYRAALAAKDIASAEREADAALAASTTRDGDGGRTGVLAINLAVVQLTAGHIDAAYTTAQEASRIAAQNPASGVNPLQAQLLLGRTELTTARESAGRAQLLTALQAAATQADVVSDAYDASVQLGNWTLSNSEFSDAVSAWAYAAQFSAGAPSDPQFARAEAWTNQGKAAVLEALSVEHDTAQGHTGTHIPFNPTDAFLNARAVLQHASDILSGYLTPANDDNAALTVGQRAYGLAHAWSAIASAWLVSTNRRAPQAPSPQNSASREAAPQSAGVAFCKMNVHMTPPPRFPTTAAANGNIGAVVMRLLLQPNGEIRDVRTAAAVPNAPDFINAVNQPASHWQAERTPDSLPNCTVPPVFFETFTFGYS